MTKSNEQKQHNAARLYAAKNPDVLSRMEAAAIKLRGHVSRFDSYLAEAKKLAKQATVPKDGVKRGDCMSECLAAFELAERDLSAAVEVADELDNLAGGQLDVFDVPRKAASE